MVIIISIEGNIGAGKTTVFEAFKHAWYESKICNRKIFFCEEPVKAWEKIVDGNGFTMLEKYYNDIERYAFSFQIMAFTSRFRNLDSIIKLDPNSIIITERSLLSDKEIFAKMLYDDKKIEEVNYQIYEQLIYKLLDDFHVNGMFYLNTPPEICSNRIKKRAREGERIEIDYLKRCDEYQKVMIRNLDHQKTKIMNINWDKDFRDIDDLSRFFNFVENVVLDNQ